MCSVCVCICEYGHHVLVYVCVCVCAKVCVYVCVCHTHLLNAPISNQADSTEVIVGPSNAGSIRFVNCAFWGPSNQIAKVGCYVCTYVWKCGS